LARLPNAEMLFTFPDFVLFRLTPSEARYIGGFARAYTLSPELLRRATHTNSA
jgi:heme iron utilization protein